MVYNKNRLGGNEMKKILVSLVVGLIIGAVAVFFIFHETTPQKIESVEKNSFYEVTSHLNMGGDLYFYVSSEKIIQKVEKFATTLRKILGDQMPADQISKLNPLQVFDFVFKLVKDSGFMEISGLGMSSIAIGNNLNHTNFVLHHYQDRGKGIIWQLMQDKPHGQDELKMLPADTVMAGFHDFNMKALWEWIKNEAETSNIPEVKKSVLSLEPLLKSQGIELEKLLGSFSGRMGMVLVLNKDKKTMLPLGNFQVEIPNPDFVLVFSTHDSYLFDLLQKKLPFAQKSEEKGVEKLIIPLPPMPVPLKPVIWQRDHLLFLASNETMVDSMFNSLKNGDGLIITDEFKKMSAYMPEKGNGFRFVSSRLFRLIIDIQHKTTQASGNLKQEENKITSEFFDMLPKELSLYSVTQNTDSGLVINFNHNFNFEYIALLPMSAIVGAISAVAIPNMLTSAQKAKQKATMADMKAIAVAIERYILEKRVAPQGNSIAEIRVQLEPEYIKQLPIKDAWGNDFAYSIGKSKTEYYLGSGGRDGLFNGFKQNGSYSIKAITDFNNDIIIQNGEFILYPDEK
jgi:hypothetical protein